MTQCDALLRELRAVGEAGLTDLEALDRLGIRRLAARINDLRAAGHDIRTFMVSTPSGKRIARYVLVVPAPAAAPMRGVQEGIAW